MAARRCVWFVIRASRTASSAWPTARQRSCSACDRLWDPRLYPDHVPFSTSTSHHIRRSSNGVEPHNLGDNIQIRASNRRQSAGEPSAEELRRAEESQALLITMAANGTPLPTEAILSGPDFQAGKFSQAQLAARLRALANGSAIPSAGIGGPSSARQSIIEATAHLARNAPAKTSKLKPEQAAVLLGTFATLGLSGLQLCDGLSLRVGSGLRRLSAQELLSATWALAFLGASRSKPSEPVFQAAARQLISRPEQFRDQDLSRLSWALNSGGFMSEDAWRSVTGELLRRAKRFSAPSLAELCSAAASANHRPPELLKALAAEVRRRGGDFTPPALAQAAIAFGVCRSDHPEALKVLCREITQQMELVHGFPRLCGVASAFASLRRGQPELWEGLWRRTERMQSFARPSDLSAMLYQLAVSGWLTQLPEAHARVKTLVSSLNRAQLKTADLCIFFQLELLLNPSEDAERSVMPSSILAAARRAWQQAALSKSAPSRFQHQIFRHVIAMGDIGAQLEHQTPDGNFTVDIALLGVSQPVAIEVDGPFHFTSTRPYRELGKTGLRRKLLEERGWRVVNIAVHDWVALSPDQQRRWLIQRLRLAGLDLPEAEQQCIGPASSARRTDAARQ